MPHSPIPTTFGCFAIFSSSESQSFLVYPSDEDGRRLLHINYRTFPQAQLLFDLSRFLSRHLLFSQRPFQKLFNYIIIIFLERMKIQMTVNINHSSKIKREKLKFKVKN